MNTKNICLAYLSIVMILCACNQQENQTEHTETTPHEHQTTNAAPTAEVQFLTPNKVWRSDSSTWMHVNALKNITRDFESENQLTRYHQLGLTLMDTIQHLIASCTMTGPDHDALHEWLEPFIKEVNLLEKTEGMKESANIFNAIVKQLHAFDKHFQL